MLHHCPQCLPQPAGAPRTRDLSYHHGFDVLALNGRRAQPAMERALSRMCLLQKSLAVERDTLPRDAPVLDRLLSGPFSGIAVVFSVRR